MSALVALGIFAAMATPAQAARATSATSSSSVTNGTGHCDAGDPLCGANPVLHGPPPPFVTIPSNCPVFLSTDSWTLAFISGNVVYHDTTNKNGDWGGFTAQGQAALTTSDDVVQYAGHLTEWSGGGNNSGAQSEGGFTLTFNGSGIAGNLSIHVAGHTTTNNDGTPTANFQNVAVTCS